MSMITRAQDLIAGRLGLEPAERVMVLGAMLRPHPSERVGYWLQLMMAAALATLGLALDSTAVVIGAMLIAPLMKPIVELAMGLATGAAPLVFRAGLRSIVSIIAVVGFATAISWLLPFHEITRELVARTTPSLIDLFVAAACALAGAYATMFSSKDMASAAAGTSIGISLVPPLCTVGYALSIGEWQMAIGAALLFTANITGIITVAGIVFVIVGFGQVDTVAEELAASSAPAGVAIRLGRHWSRAAQRLGLVSRLLLPLLLLAAIFIPLRRAVGAMTRRSEIRQTLESQLASTKFRVAQSSIEPGPNGVVVRVVIIGNAEAAQQLDQELRATLIRFGEAVPRLSVWAVPDAKSLGALATRLDQLPPPVVAEPARDLAHHTPAELFTMVQAAWPKRGTGPLLTAWMAAGPPLQIHIAHLGAPLGEAGRELLQHALEPHETSVVVETALEPVEAPTSEGIEWIARALSMETLARQLPGVSVCVVVPAPPAELIGPTPRKLTIVEDPTIAIVRSIIEANFTAGPTVMITRGDRWSLVPTLGACAPMPPSPEPAPFAPAPSPLAPASVTPPSSNPIPAP